VALCLDFPSSWVTVIEPQGTTWSWERLVFWFYSALRSLALDIDIVDLNQWALGDNAVPLNLTALGYQLVVIPSMTMVSPAAVAALANFSGHVIIGPRSFAKTTVFQNPQAPLAPEVLPMHVLRVEALPDGYQETVTLRMPFSDPSSFGTDYNVTVWKEYVRSMNPVTSQLSASSSSSAAAAAAAAAGQASAQSLGNFSSISSGVGQCTGDNAGCSSSGFGAGDPAVLMMTSPSGTTSTRYVYYLAFYPPRNLIVDLVTSVAQHIGLAVTPLPHTLRVATNVRVLRVHSNVQHRGFYVL